MKAVAAGFTMMLVLAACAKQETTTTTVETTEPAGATVSSETATVTETAPPSTTATETTLPSTTPAPTQTAAPSRKATAPAVNGPKLKPVDEAAKDPSFESFRKSLLATIRQHDAAALFKNVDPKIRTTFGPGGGVKDLEKQWKLDDPSSPFWAEMEQILTLGGTFNKQSPDPQFWAPYVYSAWPEAHDAFESAAIVATDIPLHQSADEASPPIATLSLDIVKRVSEKSGWTKVTSADGKTGYVRSKFVRSPIGYRAGFTKRNGKWMMDALVAGD